MVEEILKHLIIFLELVNCVGSSSTIRQKLANIAQKAEHIAEPLAIV